MLPMKSFTTIALAILGIAFAAPGQAQQQIGADIYGNQAAAAVKIALPFPEIGSEVSQDLIRTAFYEPLQRDLLYAEIFSFVAVPPGVVSVESAKTAGAQVMLRVATSIQAGEYVLEARLFDVASNTVTLAKRYRGRDTALTRIAHTIANDLMVFFNGKPGIFLSQIAFVSNRDGRKEIYLMDYDGANQRRITHHNNLAITPDWSSDNERLVYTAFSDSGSDLYIVNRRGGGRLKIRTGVGLNTSPTFSPDGKDIAFTGSVRGNPDIYLIRDDGSNLRRLTSGNTIESTPSWSPTGRQIAFTSSRNGTPQIYVMDAEGTNVRRISFEGEWNDDAVWSPEGDLLAYTSRVNNRFQIRIMNLATQESRIIAGEGSNEHPSWAPDGRAILFMSNRTGRWQVYRAAVDGQNLKQLTSAAENGAPDWSEKSNN